MSFTVSTGDPTRKQDVLDRIVFQTIDGVREIRPFFQRLGDDPILERPKGHILRITFPYSNEVFELVIHKPHQIKAVKIRRAQTGRVLKVPGNRVMTVVHNKDKLRKTKRIRTENLLVAPKAKPRGRSVARKQRA